jgi:predicted nucleic acid-binding protein
MKLFLDANVLVSVANQEYPLFRFSSRIISLIDNPAYQVFTSPLCLAITYYFAEKKHGASKALSKVRIISSKISITTIDQNAVMQTLQNPKIHDFEDGMEYYSALTSGCDIIITEDLDDFYFSDIPVKTCEAFCKML